MNQWWPKYWRIYAAPGEMSQGCTLVSIISDSWHADEIHLTDNSIVEHLFTSFPYYLWCIAMSLPALWGYCAPTCDMPHKEWQNMRPCLQAIRCTSTASFFVNSIDQGIDPWFNNMSTQQMHSNVGNTILRSSSFDQGNSFSYTYVESSIWSCIVSHQVNVSGDEIRRCIWYIYNLGYIWRPNTNNVMHVKNSIMYRSQGYMKTSSNGTIFRITGPLCGEFTGPGEFPAQRPMTRSFDVLFDLRLNKRLSKQPWGWWFETPSWSLWRQCNVM